MRAHMVGVFAVLWSFGVSACALPADPLIKGGEGSDPSPAPSGDNAPAVAVPSPAATGGTSTSGTAEPPAGTTSPETSGAITPSPAPPDDTYVDDLVLDGCEDPTYDGQTYAEVTRDHFTYRFLPSTAAATDLDAIAKAREGAYAATSAFLGLTEQPTITLVLSPNRVAAKAHGYRVGSSTAASNQIEVIYLPEADSYEHQHPGHEVTHVLASKLDGAATHLPLLDEGLAEYLDGSHRNLHSSYAAQLKGGAEASSSVTRFADNDVWGKNYGRAGSFVTFLIERHGKEKFFELWRASATTSSGWSLVTKDGTVVSTGVDLEKAIDRMLTSVYGTGFDAMRAEWEAELAPYLSTPAPAVGAADLAEIKHVLKGADWAINNKSASSFRATMEGFYCDVWPETTKLRIAATAVEARGTVTTELTSANAINMKNYSQAMVFAVRHEKHGSTDAATTVQIWFEHFPVGWRVTWATAW